MSMFARVVSSTLLRASGGGGGAARNGEGAQLNASSASSTTPAQGNVGTAYNQSSGSISTLQSPLDTPSPDREDGRSLAFHGHGGHGAVGGSMDDPRRARSERRVMPARLRRVSSLLAGSIEEEIAYAAAKEEADSSIPGCTAIVLTTDERTPCQTFTLGVDDAMIAHGVRGEEIQTPDFRTRDDLEVMGKTRSMRSEEDTSDAAFERRHRKADNMEKRLRKWEKENLKKDRQKIVDRIEQLRAADVRVLAPILAAREKGNHAVDETSADEKMENDDEIDQPTQLSKLESLRDDLIKQHRGVLRRYDALLTVPLEENVGGMVFGKRKAAAAAQNDTSGKPRRVISVSGAFARKSTPNVAAGPAAGSASTGSIKPSASMSALPDETEKKSNIKYSARDIEAHRLSLQDKSPKTFLDADGKVRAENTYANIHARTNGGRFAPKSALGGKTPSGPRSKINTKTGRPKSQQGLSRSARRAASAASVASTGTDKTDEDVDLNRETPVKRGPGRPRKDGNSSTASKPSSTGRPRGRPPRSSTTSQTTVDEEDVKMNNEETPRTRRVKLTFNRNKSEQNGEKDPSGSKRVAKTEDDDVSMEELTGNKVDQEIDSESEADAALSTSTTPARAALTLEQAQALFAQALADGDDDAKDEADAAAYIFPSSSL